MNHKDDNSHNQLEQQNRVNTHETWSWQ